MIPSDYKILIVDDEPDILEFVGYNLRKEGYTVITASDGPECLRTVIENRPDLILMDIRMPGMSGIETCRKIRKDPELKSVPIIFLTADKDEYIFLAAMEAGGTHFITKPVRTSILLAAIKDLIH